ncbi:hypothetical protein TEK04_19475 [Klenkia sp. LSe6-5]|uniref:Uncharacterized protein n=1 Tax=Klenkia sesuvii TaxID=3103137 RepID=A0ABU8DYJ9_9ACTN
MKKAAAWLALVLGVLALIAALVLAVLAIWTTGPTRAPLGQTAGLAASVGVVLTFGAALSLDEGGSRW